jgi:hypothetical protein
MRFPQAYVTKAITPTATGITGAAPQTVAGATLDSGLASIVIGARVYCKATTNTLTLTAKWQVLDNDGTTWIDCVESNNPANVVMATGTGSAVTATKMISAPLSVTAGSRGARVLVTSGVGVGAGAGTDEASVSYDYRAPVNVYGS